MWSILSLNLYSKKVYVMKDLQFVTPEKVGISSKNVENFIDKIEKKRINMHSFIMLRHGKIAAEGYFKPFHKDFLHRMYSTSKTFVSAAIGLLSDEGKISLDDKVIKFFPDKLPKGEIHPYVANATIRDLLMMSTPFQSTTYSVNADDWAWTFFNTPPNHPAGTIFNYDTSATYILDVIVERVTGMPFLEYMRKGLFDHIGFSKNTWCVKAPEGNSWGGSGVMATTRDLAKFALVFLNGGEYDGKQLISKEYIKAATTKQIDNNACGGNYLWSYGYGYQVWVLDDGAFAFRGMGTQLAICIPKKDFIFVCNSDTQGSAHGEHIVFDTLFDEIVDKIADELPEDKKAYESMLKRCENLEVKPIRGEAKSNKLSEINGVTYNLYDNEMEISKLSVSIEGDEGVLRYTNPRGDKEIKFGIKKFVESGFPETHYFDDTIRKPCGRMYNSISCGAWTEDNKLVIRTYIIDNYFGNLTTTLSFKGDEIGVYMFKTAEFFLNEYQGFAGGYKS